MREQLEYIWKVLKKATLDFTDDKCFRSSASLSFYTLFSLAPITLITLFVAGLFVNDVVIRDEITDRFQSLIGQQGAEGVFVLMETIRTEKTNFFSLLLGVGVLIFSATTIFVQIQEGFNEIFGVRPMEGRKAYIKLMKDRLMSMGMILSLGFVMIISLVLDTVIMAFTNAISKRFETLSIILLEFAQNILILALVYAVIFALFKVLPDVRVSRKYIFKGALVTTILLLLGKFGIGWYISTSNLSELSGASASIVILMLWVYYSSVILFFGAELIKAQTIVNNKPFRAARYARRVKLVEVEDK